MKNILFGVCGIGRGHSYRQLPLIEHFMPRARLGIFAYGESLSFYQQRYAEAENVQVVPVAVPFYVGNEGGLATGLDFAATAAHPANQQNFTAINLAALKTMAAFLGRPDFVVSDYEPICAQYAYAHQVPLVTYDQQSKYLYGDFPATLGGCTYQDEVARLLMFFPQAAARFASSFFRVAPRPAGLPVQLCPPLLRPAVSQMARHGAPAGGRAQILVYLSAQQALAQSLEDILQLLTRQEADFHVFIHSQVFTKGAVEEHPAANVRVYPHGHKAFDTVLAGCHGIVATAGHTLLAEAMHLGIPVYALPLPVYEQQMNAHIIAQHGFGVATPQLEAAALQAFLRGLPAYQQAIKTDTQVLLRPGRAPGIIAALEDCLEMKGG